MITVTTVDIKTRQMIPRIPAMNFSGGDGEPEGTEKETEKGVMGTALQSLHTQEPTRTQSYGYKLGPPTHFDHCSLSLRIYHCVFSKYKTT